MTGARSLTTPSGLMIGLVGFALHVVVGVFIFFSTLVAPPWAVAALLVVWLVALYVGGRRWQARPWMAIVLPLGMFVVWMLVLWLGDVFLGWTA